MRRPHICASCELGPGAPGGAPSSGAPGGEGPAYGHGKR